MKKFFNKMKRFVIKNKLLSILISLFILIFIFFIVIVKIFIFPSYSVDKYGNRLEGIENVIINDNRFGEIKNDFDSKDGFTIDKFRLSGKIVNIYIVVTNDMKVSDVKSEALKLINCFNEDELAYYDFQVFVTSSSDSDIYPIIGYKNKNSEGLYWNYEGEI